MKYATTSFGGSILSRKSSPLACGAWADGRRLQAEAGVAAFGCLVRWALLASKRRRADQTPIGIEDLLEALAGALRPVNIGVVPQHEPPVGTPHLPLRSTHVQLEDPVQVGAGTVPASPPPRDGAGGL
eukprot:CAMPEP_0175286966 /NCGR_PEP_ID=MMETSP0093-20121207/54037_1 /TAXON_ID=311494 /ORGANISM="Alexandrium monilatum, Strain CCMP3105" /LENGTH=127 /DNA_ID=CAMNT_0016582451 /DNA_START=109 /DNA_END=491 /DNA_ORIENTATION=+